MLNAHPSSKQRVIVVGHVACGIDMINRGATMLVDEHSVVCLDAAPSDEVHVGLDANAYNREVALDPATISRHHPPYVPIALKGRDALAEDRFHAMRDKRRIWR
jgi:hypothetical protein